METRMIMMPHYVAPDGTVYFPTKEAYQLLKKWLAMPENMHHPSPPWLRQLGDALAIIEEFGDSI